MKRKRIVKIASTAARGRGYNRTGEIAKLCVFRVKYYRAKSKAKIIDVMECAFRDYEEGLNARLMA